MNALQKQPVDPAPAPLASVSGCESATDVPDRRKVLLESALHYLGDARRFGDSYLRSQTERYIREDLAALEGRAS